MKTSEPPIQLTLPRSLVERKPTMKPILVRKNLLMVCRILLVGALLILRTTSALADITVTFDHENQPSETSCDLLDLTHNEKFKVVITNTNTDAFEYTVVGIEVFPAPSATGLRLVADTTRKELTLQHDRKYGGYKVQLTHKKPLASLVDKVWYIPVRTAGWDTDVAGGFTVSKVTDPVFEVRSGTVARNHGAEDKVALGFAGFIHVYHGKLPSLAATFGLGITDQSKTAYFFGPSWRWGEKGALTAGYSWGSVDRLPSGIHEGDVVSDPNALASLDSQVRGGVFLSLSFKFITVGDLFQKPFAGSSVSKSK